MPIRVSSARHIDSLVADLGSDQSTTREAAVARLTVFGARAVDRLVALVDSQAPPSPRILALHTLEAIAHPRALGRILDAIDDANQQVALAAIAATRPFLRASQGAHVVDRLTTAAVDASRHEALRIEALSILRDLEPSTVAPLLKSLEDDASPAVQAAARSTSVRKPEEDIVDAAERELPGQPQTLANALAHGAAAVTLPTLLRLIERVREREGTAPPEERQAWAMVRGRVHVELTNRGSRIALYDLRESIEAATDPLPVDFLAALSKAGDISCLEAVARAYERATVSAGEHDDWWRGHLADIFRTIVTREGITRRHAAVKKLDKRMKPVVDELWAEHAGGAKPASR